jgi:hypothetical protein
MPLAGQLPATVELRLLMTEIVTRLVEEARKAGGEEIKISTNARTATVLYADKHRRLSCSTSTVALTQWRRKEQIIMAWNFNTVKEEATKHSIIPEGSVVELKAKVSRGGEGEDSCLTMSSKGVLLMLVLDLTPASGDGGTFREWFSCDIDEHMARSLTGSELDKKQTAARIGRKKLSDIWESAHGISDKDNSEAANKIRENASPGQFEGLTFIAEVGVKPAEGRFPSRNYIERIVWPDDPEWPAGRPTVTPVQPKPVWGNGMGRSMRNDLSDDVPF